LEFVSVSRYLSPVCEAMWIVFIGNGVFSVCEELSSPWAKILHCSKFCYRK